MIYFSKCVLNLHAPPAIPIDLPTKAFLVYILFPEVLCSLTEILSQLLPGRFAHVWDKGCTWMIER